MIVFVAPSVAIFIAILPNIVAFGKIFVRL